MLLYKLIRLKWSYLKFDDGSFVVVHIAVVWSGEYGDYHWELRRTVPLMHLVAIELCLVGSQD